MFSKRITSIECVMQCANVMPFSRLCSIQNHNAMLMERTAQVASALNNTPESLGCRREAVI